MIFRLWGKGGSSRLVRIDSNYIYSGRGFYATLQGSPGSLRVEGMEIRDYSARMYVELVAAREGGVRRAGSSGQCVLLPGTGGEGCFLLRKI